MSDNKKTDHKGYGFDKITDFYCFNYVPNVASLIKDIKLLKETEKGNPFQQTYVVDGLSTKTGGHAYAVNVIHRDGKYYATIFDSVASLCPAFINEIGDTFEQVMINANQFQHTLIGCRGYALDVFKILTLDIKNGFEENERQEKGMTYNYYYNYIDRNFTSDNKRDINEYRKDLFDYITKEQTNIVYLNKILQSKKNDIEDKIDTGFQTKEEIKFLENKITQLTKELQTYVNNEIKKDGFDIKKFITNIKDDVTKLKPQQIIDQIFLNSKNIYSFDIYPPQMTHLMNDYKTLRKHILYYTNKVNENDQLFDYLSALEKIPDEQKTPEQIQIYTFYQQNKSNIDNNRQYYKDAVVTIREEIERGIKYDCFKVSDSNIGKDPKTGQKFKSKADEIIAQIIKNPKSEYCFSGYKRRELNHLWFGPVTKLLTGYNPESHSMGRKPPVAINR